MAMQVLAMIVVILMVSLLLGLRYVIFASGANQPARYHAYFAVADDPDWPELDDRFDDRSDSHTRGEAVDLPNNAPVEWPSELEFPVESNVCLVGSGSDKPAKARSSSSG